MWGAGSAPSPASQTQETKALPTEFLSLRTQTFVQAVPGPSCLWTCIAHRCTASVRFKNKYASSSSEALAHPALSPGRGNPARSALQAEQLCLPLPLPLAFAAHSDARPSRAPGCLSVSQFSRSLVSDSLRPHGLQHARLPCPSPTPRAFSNSCHSSRRCHQTISSFVVPFSSCPRSFPASGSFPMSQLFTSGGQSAGVSASASVLPLDIQDLYIAPAGCGTNIIRGFFINKPAKARGRPCGASASPLQAQVVSCSRQAGCFSIPCCDFCFIRLT